MYTHDTSEITRNSFRGGALKNCTERRRENIWGISCQKSRFYAKKSYFFSNFRDPPLVFVFALSLCLEISSDLGFLHKCVLFLRVLYCCCVSIIIVICICPPGALIWLINLFLFSISVVEEINS